jgi:16S rRNA C967 or C1407 C5-methylase (RsmB/RsmF family)
VSPEENEYQVAWLLEKFPELSLVKQWMVPTRVAQYLLHIFQFLMPLLDLREREREREREMDEWL